MHQHLEQGLVANALALSQFPRFRHVGLRQSQRNLDALGPVQSADQMRPFRRCSFFEERRGLPFYKFPTLAAGPPVRLFFIACKFRHFHRALFIASFPSQPRREIVPVLPGIQGLRRDHTDPLIALH